MFKLNPFVSPVLKGLSAALLLTASSAPGQTIFVPGASFESPTAPLPPFPIHPGIDSWQKTEQPFWYDPVQFGNTPWNMLSGVFPNPISSAPDHIANLDGNQAGFLLAVPSVGIFQDYQTVDWNDVTPTHAFTATYEAGKSYQLTVGVLGSAGLSEGAALRLSLYYRDGSNLRTAIGFTDVLYAGSIFPDINHLVDFSVQLPVVQATDAWAGQNIGIGIEVMTPGGTGVTYWDVDNVRLVAAVPEPTALALLGLAAGILTARRVRSSRA